MATAKRNGRTRRERLNADNLKAARLQPCARCGMDIDYTAPPEDPEAFNAGHAKAWINHPELRADPANLRPEHARCNKAGQTKEGLELGLNSTDW